MAYPADIYDPRTKENLPNVVYDADETTRLFAEDATQLDTEVVAIETKLGITDAVVNECGGLKPDTDAVDAIQLQKSDGTPVVAVDTLSDEGHLQALSSDGDGSVWREFHIGAERVSPGQSGATLSAQSASIFYLLDAIAEYLYFSNDIHEEWDGNSDIVVEIFVALNVNETANDLIRASLLVDYYTNHDDMDTPKTQTRSVDHNIGVFNSAGDVHKITFILDYDLVDNVIESGDLLKMRFWLDDITTAPVVTAVRFLFANVKYRSKFYNMPYGGTFPTEG